MSHTGYVLSDLHLFTDRSSAELYGEQIVEISHQADFIVLNGDIFDFKWARFKSVEESIRGAIDWLDILCARNKHCQIYYVMGNHDCLESFAEALDRIEHENFHWSPTHFRIGQALFLHGDLPLSGRDPFKRKLIKEEVVPSERANQLYTRIVNMRLHRVADLVNRKNKSVRSICAALGKFACPDSEGVRDIYFGHTHVYFEELSFGGYVFHNTGGAIRGVQKKILRVKV